MPNFQAGPKGDQRGYDADRNELLQMIQGLQRTIGELKQQLNQQPRTSNTTRVVSPSTPYTAPISSPPVPGSGGGSPVTIPGAGIVKSNGSALQTAVASPGDTTGDYVSPSDPRNENARLDLLINGSPASAARRRKINLIDTASVTFAATDNPGSDQIDVEATATPGGTGTVTSVSLNAPAGVFSVGGSPVTTSGALTLSFVNQSANTVFAGPGSGSAAAPTFRALVPVDYPVFIASGASHARGAVPDPGSTSGTAKFLREDATWATPPSGGGGGLTGTANNTTRFDGSGNEVETGFVTNDETGIVINPAGDVGTGGDGVNRLWVKGRSPGAYPYQALVQIGDDSSAGPTIPSPPYFPDGVVLASVGCVDGDAAILLTHNGGYGLLIANRYNPGAANLHYAIGGAGVGNSPLILQSLGGYVGIGPVGPGPILRFPTEMLEVFGVALTEQYKCYGETAPGDGDFVPLTGITAVVPPGSSIRFVGGIAVDYSVGGDISDP